MLGFLLFILAHILVYPLTLMNYYNVSMDNRKGYFRDTSKSIDVWACREFRATWNKWLITQKGTNSELKEKQFRVHWVKTYSSEP